MLFEIERCYPASLTGANNIEKREVISTLLKSNYIRSNIVLFCREDLEEIISSGLYSENDKVRANEILMMRREVYQLKGALTFFCKITFSSEGLSEINVNGRITEKRLSFDYFKSEHAGNSPFLITEGQDDFDLFNIVGDWYISNFLNKSIALKFNFLLGGGSQSKPIFDRQESFAPFTLCITDNDKRHPNGCEQSTSLAFTSHDRIFSSTKLAFILDVRESENLIPHGILDSLFSNVLSSERQKYQTIDRIIQVDPTTAMYFDFKDGMQLCDFMRIDNDFGDYWMPVISGLNMFRDSRCLRQGACLTSNRCNVVHGLGNNLLRRAIAELSTLHLRDLFTGIERDKENIWTSIGSLVSNWGCVLTTKPTRS